MNDKIRNDDALIIDYIPATALTATGAHRRPTLFFFNARSGDKSRWRRSCHFTCVPGCEKIAMTTPLSDNRFLPQDTGFKHWSCFCPPQTPAKKLAVVPSLQPAFLKMPMAPTFLSSSNTRRHNNARPHPLHTLLSAAAERSSYG